MHTRVGNYLRAVKYMFPSHFENATVLDCGSLDLNGNNREFLDNCDYLGIDIVSGKNVDVVCRVKDYNPGRKFKTILSTEMLEHDCTWRESIQHMYNLLEDGGLLVCSCGGIARREHGTSNSSPYNSPGTNDYYRNLDSQDILSILPNAVIEEEPIREDIRFYAIKK